jgi:restriction endonuclease Mrr
VIALITRPSPHVFYEIGYAEGIGKKIVILSESEAHLPSDLKAMRMVSFDPYDSSFIYRLLEILEEEPDQMEEEKMEHMLRDHPERIFRLFHEHRASFERVDNRTFEQIVARLFQSRGFDLDNHSERSPASYDFLLRQFEGSSRIVVEVKKYSASSKVSVGQVQQLLGAVAAERADLGILITPSDFTKTAVDFASRCHPRIELWSLKDLESRLGFTAV